MLVLIWSTVSCLLHLCSHIPPSGQCNMRTTFSACSLNDISLFYVEGFGHTLPLLSSLVVLYPLDVFSRLLCSLMSKCNKTSPFVHSLTLRKRSFYLAFTGRESSVESEGLNSLFFTMIEWSYDKFPFSKLFRSKVTTLQKLPLLLSTLIKVGWSLCSLYVAVKPELSCFI